MARITVGEHPTIEVDLSALGGGIYTAVPITKGRLAELEKLQEAAGGAEDANGYVEAMSKALDVRLQPFGENGDKKPAKASTVVLKAWREDKLTVAQLDKIVADVNEADRPT